MKEKLKDALERWKADIQRCAPFEVTTIMVQNAYQKQVDYCKINNFENFVYSQLSSSFRDSLVDYIYIELIGFRAPQYGDSKEYKQKCAKLLANITIF